MTFVPNLPCPFREDASAGTLVCVRDLDHTGRHCLTPEKPASRTTKRGDTR
jgi:hypothetical protein